MKDELLRYKQCSAKTLKLVTDFLSEGNDCSFGKYSLNFREVLDYYAINCRLRVRDCNTDCNAYVQTQYIFLLRIFKKMKRNGASTYLPL